MKYKITLNGKCYEVVVEKGQAVIENEYEAPVAAAPAAPAPVAAPAPAATPAAAPAPAAAPVATAAGEQIKAPMPGTILKVNVTQGAAVKKGDVLVVLEAMKMENDIVAPRDGSIAQVVATKGSSVDTGAVLVVLA